MLSLHFGLLWGYRGVYHRENIQKRMYKYRLKQRFFMPKVNSELMENEHFQKMFVQKFGVEPTVYFNKYGENYNAIEFGIDDNGNLRALVRSDIAELVCKKLEYNIGNSNSRQFRNLTRTKCGDSETLQQFFNATRHEIQGGSQDLMVGGEPNLNVLRFNKVGDKNGQRVTFKGVYLLEDVKRWANAARDLIAKCQRELLTEVFQEFSGVLKIHVTSKIEYVDEVQNS